MIAGPLVVRGVPQLPRRVLALMATAGSHDYQALAMALALMVGVIMIAGSLFRLGYGLSRKVRDNFPKHVTVGTVGVRTGYRRPVR